MSQKRDRVKGPNFLKIGRSHAMQLLQLLAGLQPKVEGWLIAIGETLIMVLMMIVVAEIVCRPLFRSIPGEYELAELLIVAVVFLGMANTQSHGDHVGMDLLTSRLKPKSRRLLEIITLSLSLAVFIVIMVKSSAVAYSAWKRNEATMGLISFPVWPSKILLPIGSFFLCLRFIREIVENLILMIHREDVGRPGSELEGGS